MNNDGSEKTTFCGKRSFKGKYYKLNENLPAQIRTSKKYDALQKELFLKKHELDLLRQEIKSSNPLYYQNFLDTSFITVNEINQKV
jgi:hypothetical protein